MTIFMAPVSNELFASFCIYMSELGNLRQSVNIDYVKNRHVVESSPVQEFYIGAVTACICIKSRSKLWPVYPRSYGTLPISNSPSSSVVLIGERRSKLAVSYQEAQFQSSQHSQASSSNIYIFSHLWIISHWRTSSAYLLWVLNYIVPLSIRRNSWNSVNVSRVVIVGIKS